MFILGGGVEAWRTARQMTIARSTMKSKFVALELISSEIDWLINFFNSIPSTKDLLHPVFTYCDYQAAIFYC